jgi:outer membrane lipoprotein-sorting protein
MKRRWGCLTALATIGMMLPAVGAQAQDNAARDLVQKVRDAAPKVPFRARMVLTSDRGWERDLELSHKRLSDGTEASYMEVTAPMDLKDTRFLVFDHPSGRDEQFIYVPAARRAIQVGAQTRKQEFLGSEFAVGDLVQPDVGAFTYSFVGEEDVGGHHCKLVEAVPKTPGDELYAKTVFAIDPTALVVMRTQFFDDKGQLLKVWTVEKLEQREGRWTPLQQEMKNVQDHHWSRITLTDVQYNAKLPDETFNRSYLTR